jgi:hypothetical protein
MKTTNKLLNKFIHLKTIFHSDGQIKIFYNFAYFYTFGKSHLFIALSKLIYYNTKNFASKIKKDSIHQDKMSLKI